MLSKLPVIVLSSMPWVPVTTIFFVPAVTCQQTWWMSWDLALVGLSLWGWKQWGSRMMIICWFENRFGLQDSTIAS